MHRHEYCHVSQEGSSVFQSSLNCGLTQWFSNFFYTKYNLWKHWALLVQYLYVPTAVTVQLSTVFEKRILTLLLRFNSQAELTQQLFISIPLFESPSITAGSRTIVWESLVLYLESVVGLNFVGKESFWKGIFFSVKNPLIIRKKWM